MKESTLKLQFLKSIGLFRPALGLAMGCLFLVSCSNDKNLPGEQESTGAATESSAAAEAPAADEGKGIGPIKNVDLGAGVDQVLADKGKAVFESKCTACHKFGEKYVGPDLAGVAERRKPEWIMNMVLNPQEMVQQDSTAKELLAAFMTQMPNQNLTEEEARSVLEYFRTQPKK